MKPKDAVASPCNSVCRMDAASGWCEGCLRTLDEIADWSSLTTRPSAGSGVQLRQRRVVWRRRPRPPAAVPGE